MKFGSIPIDQALGAILAHSRQLGGRRLRKGQRLGEAELELLRREGISEIVVARLEPGDLDEDAAAGALAVAAAGPGVHAESPTTGRSNLFADADGLLLVDAAAVNEVNLLGEELTVATLPPHTPVRRGQMLATVKVIPFAVPAERVQNAAELARRAGGLLRVAPFRPLRAALVQTRLPDTRESMLDKTLGATRERLRRVDAELTQELRCSHDEAALAAALAELLADGAELLIVIGASAIVDRADVIPAAIARAGGEVLHFGMPVDPGNLLLLGRVGEVPVIGLPGCARSPLRNGIDLVLGRLAAGEAVDAETVMRMGVGGLLQEALVDHRMRQAAVRRADRHDR